MPAIWSIIVKMRRRKGWGNKQQSYRSWKYFYEKDKRKYIIWEEGQPNSEEEIESD